MSNTMKLIIGIIIGLVVLFALPFLWQAIFSGYSYGMMGPGMMEFGRRPMMGGPGIMPFGIIFMWLIPVGLLVLIGLGIAALVKYLVEKPQ